MSIYRLEYETSDFIGSVPFRKHIIDWEGFPSKWHLEKWKNNMNKALAPLGSLYQNSLDAGHIICVQTCKIIRNEDEKIIVMI